MSVFKDVADPDPARRYKMVTTSHSPYGYYTFVSPGGITWIIDRDKPMAPGLDVITAFYDPRRELYVAFAKRATDWRGYQRRSFYTVTSKDFRTWSEGGDFFVVCKKVYTRKTSLYSRNLSKLETHS